MILIADSGSTKVAWRVLHSDGTIQAIQTIGINPFFVSEEDILKTLEESLKPGIRGNVEQVFFYGAGVAGNDKIEILTRCFHKAFPGCKVEANSDLLAAARCLCGAEEGIAAILGTGANTCFYDGEKIVDNVPACGYILGDEGGGAVLGKKLVSDYLKRMLPEDLSEAFEKHYKLGLLDIIESIRDLTTSVLDTHLSATSNRLNDIMKTLTIITTLFMPLSFVASFMGMNFFGPSTPLPAWTSVPALAVTLVIMALTPLAMYLWMRGRRWM